MSTMDENALDYDTTPPYPVELDGTTLHVTPTTELPFPKSLAAATISSRIITKMDRSEEAGEQAVGVDEDMYQLLELCVEDGIRRETLEALGPHDLTDVLEIAFIHAEPEVESDGDD